MLNEILGWVAVVGFFIGVPVGDPLAGFSLTDVRAGTGQVAREGDIVTLHFLASTQAGKELASTEKRGLPYRFRLGGGEVPMFFELSVYGMKEGGERKAIVPPSLGYGMAGVQPIVPPKTTLVVLVKLVKVDKGK